MRLSNFFRSSGNTTIKQDLIWGPPLAFSLFFLSLSLSLVDASFPTPPMIVRSLAPFIPYCDESWAEWVLHMGSAVPFSCMYILHRRTSWVQMTIVCGAQRIRPLQSPSFPLHLQWWSWPPVFGIGGQYRTGKKGGLVKVIKLPDQESCACPLFCRIIPLFVCSSSVAFSILLPPKSCSPVSPTPG